MVTYVKNNGKMKESEQEEGLAVKKDGKKEYPLKKRTRLKQLFCKHESVGRTAWEQYTTYKNETFRLVMYSCGNCGHCFYQEEKADEFWSEEDKHFFEENAKKREEERQEQLRANPTLTLESGGLKMVFRKDGAIQAESRKETADIFKGHPFHYVSDDVDIYLSEEMSRDLIGRKSVDL